MKTEFKAVKFLKQPEMMKLVLECLLVVMTTFVSRVMSHFVSHLHQRACIVNKRNHSDRVSFHCSVSP